MKICLVRSESVRGTVAFSLKMLEKGSDKRVHDRLSPQNGQRNWNRTLRANRQLLLDEFLTALRAFQVFSF